jgi:hypothetical protein
MSEQVESNKKDEAQPAAESAAAQKKGEVGTIELSDALKAPSQLEAEENSLTSQFNKNKGQLPQHLKTKFDIDIDAMDLYLVQMLSEMSFAEGEDGALYIKGEESTYKVHEGKVAIAEEGLNAESDDFLEKAFEGFQVYKAVRPDSQAVNINGPDGVKKLVMEKVAELNGLEVKNKSEDSLDKLHPDLAKKVEEQWEAYAKENKIGEPKAEQGVTIAAADTKPEAETKAPETPAQNNQNIEVPMGP